MVSGASWGRSTQVPCLMTRPTRRKSLRPLSGGYQTRSKSLPSTPHRLPILLGEELRRHSAPLDCSTLIHDDTACAHAKHNYVESLIRWSCLQCAKACSHCPPCLSHFTSSYKRSRSSWCCCPYRQTLWIECYPGNMGPPIRAQIADCAMSCPHRHSKTGFDISGL